MSAGPRRAGPVRVGFSSYAVGWAVGVPGHAPASPLDALGVVRRAARLGFRCAQLADNTPLHALSRAAWSELLGEARRLGVALEVGTRGLTEENVVRHLALAAEAGSPFCRIVIDLPGYEPRHDEIVALLRRLRPSLEQRRIVLAIENHDRFAAAELREIVAAAETPWIGICLDTANSLGAGEGLSEVVGALAPFAVNLHLKDFVVRRLPHAFGFVVEGAPLGQGRLDEARTKADLARMPRCASVTLEHWTPPAESIAATIAREAEWCECSAATLRRWWPEALGEPCAAEGG